MINSAFVAYPSKPAEIGHTISAAGIILQTRKGMKGFKTWECQEIIGRYIDAEVKRGIENSDCLIADITRLNFNVVFEIGFAIGLRKGVALIRNKAINVDSNLMREVGIFDTIGYSSYSNSNELVEFVETLSRPPPLISTEQIGQRQPPIFVVLPAVKSDFEIRLQSRIKKTGFPYRSFDPEETHRLAPNSAITFVMQAQGVVAPILAAQHPDAAAHNIRSAFVFGLAAGMGREILPIYCGPDLPELDIRDQSFICKTPDEIDKLVADFGPQIAQRQGTPVQSAKVKPGDLLQKLNLGTSNAENEYQELENYYLETEEYRKAFRGEVDLVIGRKGSGKTALFFHLRNKIRSNNANIVLDLRPEGFQLSKFKEFVEDILNQGTKEHTLIAFAEYLLWLEICHRILYTQRSRSSADAKLYEVYHRLSDEYEQDQFIVEGDFAERLSKLVDVVHGKFREFLGVNGRGTTLSREKITELVYVHDIARLRKHVCEYLSEKGNNGLWILIDNLDKGWSYKGVSGTDILILRCLGEAMVRIRNSLPKLKDDRKFGGVGILFIRNDVYDHLVETTPDRGKVRKVSVDWSDRDTLKEMLRLRFIYLIGDEKLDDKQMEQLWETICISHVKGENSLEYLIDRSLMRPRAAIEFFQQCRSHAINLGRRKIGEDDILKAEVTYSGDLLGNLNYELRDVSPESEDFLYEFLEAPSFIRHTQVLEIFNRKKVKPEILDLLLWFGFLGIQRNNSITYSKFRTFDFSSAARRPGGNQTKESSIWYKVVA